MPLFFLDSNMAFDNKFDKVKLSELRQSFPLECSYDLNKYLSSMVIDLSYMAERNFKNLIYKILGK